jgi:hypothetical protein
LAYAAAESVNRALRWFYLPHEAFNRPLKPFMRPLKWFCKEKNSEKIKILSVGGQPR